jgi:hypothetical protein
MRKKTVRLVIHLISLFVLGLGILLSHAATAIQRDDRVLSPAPTQPVPVVTQLNLVVPDLPEPMVITLSGLAILVTSCHLLRRRA